MILNFDEFQKIISSKKFVAQFGDIDKTQALSRPPKGYDETNEAIEYLKLNLNKQFLFFSLFFSLCLLFHY